MRAQANPFKYVVFLILILFIFSNSCKDDEEPSKGSIRGTVVLIGTQIPIEGILISLSGSRSGSDLTDQNGQFEFKELPIGEYTLTVSVPSSYQQVGTITQSVRSDQVTRVDISLTPKGALCGKITEEGKTDGIVGANVTLSGGPGDRTESVTTDNSGEYCFSPLPDGEYQITVSHPDFVDAERTFIVLDGDKAIGNISLQRPGAVLEVFPMMLDFGFNENQLVLDISNEGIEELSWSITLDRPELSVFPVNGKLNPGQSSSVSFLLDRFGLEPGDYSYTITIQSNAGSKAVRISFKVAESESCDNNLILSFDVNNNGCGAPCEINIINSSQNVQSYLWDFGDGETSTDPFPTHEYLKPGNYNLKLIGTNGDCQDSLTKPVNIQWNTFSRTYGGGGGDYGRSVINTSDNGFIIAGYKDNPTAEKSDFYLIKTNVKGDTQWEKTLGRSSRDNGQSIKQTSDGGYIISGESFNEDLSNGDLYLVKTTSNGNVQWEASYGTGKYEIGYSVIQTQDGGFLATGQSYDFQSEKGGMYVVKVNSVGNIEWEQTYGNAQTTNDQTVGFSAIQPSDGGYLIAGYTNTKGAGAFDVYLLKISASGVVEWDNTFGGTVTEEGFSLAQTSDGGYIIAGRTESIGAGGSDVYLLKTNSRGFLEWEKTYGGGGNDVGRSVVQTLDGGYLIGGYTSSLGAGGDDMYLIKTDASGNLEWEKAYGGNSRELGFSVVQVPDMGFVIVGQTASFGAGGTDVYMVKTDDLGNTQ